MTCFTQVLRVGLALTVGAALIGCTAPGGPDKIKSSEFPTQMNVMAGGPDAGVTTPRALKCSPVSSSQFLPARAAITAGVTTAAAQPTYFTADLFNLFKSVCGGCHVENSLGGFLVTADNFTTTVTATKAAVIKSDDPAVYMPPAGGGGMPYSQRTSTDAVVQLYTLLELWLAQGSPAGSFDLPAPSGGSATGTTAAFAVSKTMGAQLTNIGTCVPDKGMVGASESDMKTRDAFFAQATALPPTLDETDFVSFDSEVLAKQGVVSYAPTYPLWTDNAGKMRYVRVPLGQSIVFDKETQQFHIPTNTRFYKTFLKQVVDAKGVIGWRKMETRVIVSRPDVNLSDGTAQQTALYGTYIWNDDESQATLLDDPLRDSKPFADRISTYITNEQLAAPIIAKNPRNLAQDLLDAGASRHYAFPGSERCVQCHMGSPSQSFVLGFTPLQVARRAEGNGGTYELAAGDELTQLQRLIDYGVITGITSPADVLPLEESEGDRKPRTPQELAAQAYMVGNCAHCHNPRGLPSVRQPLLKDVLIFLPGSGTNEGIFEFPLDRVSPIRKRDVLQDVDIAYVSPSLYDDARGDALAKYFCANMPEGSCTPSAVQPDPNLPPPALPIPTFVLAPWRSLIYRNVDTPYDYFDDNAAFPHMPLNSPGYDCRTAQIMGDWMVSIPAKIIDPTKSESAIPAMNGSFGPRANADPVPYVEVKPGDPDYATAVSDAQDRLTAYHTGYRYNFCPPSYTADIIDPVIQNEADTGEPVVSDAGPVFDSKDPTKMIMPMLTPLRPHFVSYDDTDPPGPWFPRRPDWADALVNPNVATFVASATQAEGLTADQTEDLTNVINALESVTLSTATRAALTQVLPYGVWDTTMPGCDFSSIPKVSSAMGAGQPRWIDIAKPSPDAPLFSQSPGAAIFTSICFNCHGINADSQGLLADEISTLTGGAARVADFRDGLFGPVAMPGANRAAIFDPGATMLPGVTGDDLAARYMAWMALGGTSKHLPEDVLDQVAEAPVLGQLRDHISQAGTPDMLRLGLILCEQIATSSPDLTSLPLADFISGGDWNWTAHTGLIDTNGDAEMWLRLCNLGNRPIVRVPTLSGTNTGQWDATVGPGNLNISGYSLYWGADEQGKDLYGANPVMDQLGNVSTGLTPDNLLPLCIQQPTSASEAAFATQFVQKHTVAGNPIPFCPTGIITPGNQLQFAGGNAPNPDFTDVASAGRASPPNVVRLALARCGLGLVPPLEDGLRAAERCLAGESAPGKFYENLARVRTLVAALIAKVIGYKGRITGWQKAGEYAFYLPAPDTWWKADADVAPTYYSANVDAPVVDVAGLWPTVEVPEVPDSGVLGLLARYARGLASKTDGRVYAELQPLALDGANAERRYELALRASSRPSSKITLFIARTSGEAIEIEGWTEPTTLTNGTETGSFLKDVAEAPETIAAIERLLLTSLEASRHGES